MCFVKLIAHLDYIVNRKLGRSVRIKHCRVVNMLALARCRRFYRKELDVDIGHIHSGTLYGESAHSRRVNSVAVNKAGNFNAGVVGKILNKTVVYNIRTDFVRLVGHYSLNYARCIFS